MKGKSEAKRARDSLAQVPLFAGLPPRHLKRIGDLTEEVRFMEGATVVRQGDAGDTFFVILEGEAGVVLSGEELTTLQRGEFFGELSVLLGEPPASDIVAKTTLRCLVIPGPQLRSFLLAHPEVMLQMLLSVTWRLRTTLAWLS